MESCKVDLLIFTLVTLLVVSVDGQIITPCSASVITSFTPCLNFVTGSSNNGTSPTASCCNSFKSIMSTSVECACLLVTANVPIPFNRTLSISLPRICKISLPLKCKDPADPLPAPGPVLFGPEASPLPPTAAPHFNPRTSKASALAPAPESETIEPKETSAPKTTPTSASTPNYNLTYNTKGYAFLMFVAFMAFA